MLKHTVEVAGQFNDENELEAYVEVAGEVAGEAVEARLRTDLAGFSFHPSYPILK